MIGEAEKEAVLLARFCPVIQYDSQESFASDSVAMMTDCVPAASAPGNALRRSDAAVLATASAGPGTAQLSVDFLGPHHYADGRAVAREDYLDAVGHDYVVDARAMHARPGYAHHVYGHAVLDRRGALWLQYWFFYYYNDKAFLFSGLHEGDWEMIQLRLTGDGQPDVVTYAQHTDGEGGTWRDVEQDAGPVGPVPAVYSARGSHASYFRRGTYPEAPIVPDHNDGRGPRVRPTLTLLSDDQPGWAGWPGRWGSTRARVGPFGANSPRGPREHLQWRDPLAFHEAARPARERGAVAGTALPAPPAPEISARREGDRAVIAYHLRDVGGARTPTRLVLSLDGHGDDRPPATTSVDVAPGAGEIELPFALEPRDYTVRASAVNEDGVTGPTVDAPLA